MSGNDGVDPNFLSDLVAEVHTVDVAGLVRTASRQSLEWYRQFDQVENKAQGEGFDPVTVADRKVEQTLRSLLREHFPNHAIVGEEFGLDGGGSVLWTIDPIDGTRAFIVGQPMWGTLLGLSIDRRPVAGWMHQPVLDETYCGLTGPAFEPSATLLTAEHSRPLSVSTTEQLSDAIVLCTSPTMFETAEQMTRFSTVADSARMVRYSGDCVNYGLLAMGLADAVVENQLAHYDIVPLIPLIEGAGGLITDLDGNRPVDGGFVVAAATEVLHRQLLDRLV